jgi:hypothetical protein
MLLSDADGVEWKCSKSVLILTTCVLNREVRFTSMNWRRQFDPSRPKSPNRRYGSVLEMTVGGKPVKK